MKILFDLNHPAHVNFFRVPARLLMDAGHQVVFTSREKDVTIQLLDQFGFEHIKLSSIGKKGMLSLAGELVSRNFALYRTVRAVKPDIMAAIGGTFIAHVGLLSRIPSIVFYDTENAKLQNLITYPFSDCVVVPQCYYSWLPKHHIKYSGYHELSYLHPDYFKPDKAVAETSGLSFSGKNIFIRLVSWEANHDIGEIGWSVELLRKLIARYREEANIIISSELDLGEEFSAFLYKGRACDIHHVMAFCSLVVGESATMASEAAVLGVPAIYAAQTGRGYTDEQESKYGLVKNVKKLDWVQLELAIDEVLSQPVEFYLGARSRLLSDTIDVAGFVVDVLTGWPDGIERLSLD